MDKSAIRNFAVWARVNLMDSVAQKAFEYGIEKNGSFAESADSIGGRLLTTEEKNKRNHLIARIKEIGYQEVIEEVAYTWFNRFTALRFMEVNEYLPSRVRVFTNEKGEFEPDILREALTVELEGLERSKVVECIERQNTEELYRYLLVTQCNALSDVLSPLFTKLDDYVELLLPNNLLRKDSVLDHMVRDIPEENWKEQVEIIGWLYQYYISEKHEEVVDPLHGKMIKKEDVPAATQLFTTEWVVRYIVDNSLGRYWIERNPNSALKNQLQYLALPKDGEFAVVNEKVSPQEIKVLDPCVGSGHFLAYAFDVLIKIYSECGYSERDAAESILQNNLFGLDLDNRAVQLACFSLKMKARNYSRRILNKRSEELEEHIYSIEESNQVDLRLLSYLGEEKETAKQLVERFIDAKEYGSIIKLPFSLNDILAVKSKLLGIQDKHYSDLIEQSDVKTLVQNLLPIVNQSVVLTQKYQIVVTNPPYLNKYDAKLSQYVKDWYEDYKGDLFSVFMFRNFDFCEKGGYSGLMTPNVWMFIKTYEKLRTYILTQKHITTLVQMAKGAFFKEATVDVCAFVLQNKYVNEKGIYFRLEDFKGDMQVQDIALKNALQDKSCGYYYNADSLNFSKIPGSPIAYWVSKSFVRAYQNKKISDYGIARSGLQTGNNELFLRYWHEVVFDNIAFNMSNKLQFLMSRKKWTPQIKGGNYRKWYGNFDYIVNWENDGEAIRQCEGCRLNIMVNEDLYFKAGITWSHTTSSIFGARYLTQGCLFNVEAPTLFVDKTDEFYFLGYLNSCISALYLNAINATMHYLVGNILALPVAVIESQNIDKVVNQNISLSKTDWDSYETSWDFKKHPLV